MILLDFSGTIFASVYVDVAKNNDTSKDFLRHLLITQIRTYNKKFKDEYGDLVICADAKGTYWRRDIFPFYKANRKKARELSNIDWKQVFEHIGDIISEIKTYLPYKFIQIDNLEADDIIATLALNPPESDDLFEGNEDVLIISNDHDFRQLHDVDYIKQYFPQKKRFEREAYANLYLFEHICKGDPGDGIPNIKSDPDTFVNEDKRQKAVTKTFIKSCYTNGVPDIHRARFEKNKKLIDLRQLDESYKELIINTYNNTTIPKKSKLMFYLGSHKLQKNLDCINDF